MHLLTYIYCKLYTFFLENINYFNYIDKTDHTDPYLISIFVFFGF